MESGDINNMKATDTVVKSGFMGVDDFNSFFHHAQFVEVQPPSELILGRNWGEKGKMVNIIVESIVQCC